FELRNMFVFSQSPVMPGPEVVMPFAPKCFDEAGNLTDPVATERIGVLFEKLRGHVLASRMEAAVRWSPAPSSPAPPPAPPARARAGTPARASTTPPRASAPRWR